MRFSLWHLAASLLLFGHGYGLESGAEFAVQADPPSLAEMDSFYDPPKGFEKEAVGTILRYRKPPRPIGILNTSVEVGDAWQILYRTQDAEGQPQATALTILKPKQPKPRGNLWVEAYFSNAAFAGCSPSLALQLGNRPDNAFPQFQTFRVLTSLGQGYYVLVADDNGPRAACMAGPQLGYATLDGVRAALKSGFLTGLPESPIITLNGYSGSASTVAWATELQPIYAPELKIAGAAIGGVTANLTESIRVPTDYNYAYLSIPTILGLAHAYKNLSLWLDAELKPETKSQFMAAETQCFVSNQKGFVNSTFESFFKRGRQGLLIDEVPLSVISNAGVLGKRATPQIPWYLYGAIHDLLAPAAPVWDLYQKHCKNGATIEYQQNIVKNISHTEESFVAFDDAFTWLKDRHAGKPIQTKTPCVTYDWKSPHISVSIDKFVPYLPIPVVPLLIDMLTPLMAEFL